MSKFRHVWVAGLVGWTLACGARIDDPVGNGSNTNWLSGCKEDRECGDGICASGACTPSCNRDKDCASLGDEAACGDSVLVVSANADACDEAVSQQVCAPKCDGDDACENIGDGYTCQAGVCVPATCVTPEPPQPYEPCAGHACGDTCRQCDPADADCAESEEPKYCDAAGECSGTAPTCPSTPVSPSTACAERTPDQCMGECAMAAGAAVVECELQATNPVACVSYLASSGEACAIHPTDGLCYRFSDTYQLETWEDVACDDARCALDGCGDDACYSPTMNLSQAYAGTIQGCACEDVGSVCIGGTALICMSGNWAAVEDGPCFPSEEPCAGRVADVEQCIELFATCRDLSNGLFCGLSPRTSLCENGEIVQDQSLCYQDDAFCEQLENGLWCTGGLEVSCPENYAPSENECDRSNVLCVQAGFALTCRLQTLSDEECLAVDGESVNDPGDGSLYTEGCPDGGQAVGLLDHGAEGGLCCVSPNTADAG